MSNSQRQITDEYLNVHLKGEVLGQGGQGVVHRTKDPDLALKLLCDPSGSPVTDPAEMAAYRERLRNFRLLPIPRDLKLAAPLALLKDQAGYVMHLLSDMVSFNALMPGAANGMAFDESQKPSWLANVPEDLARRLTHYRDSGGLRRRLTVLYKCASLLARLHGNGLVYGDVSPNNAFCSSDLSRSEVWLIDADNVRFETPVPGEQVYTPRFGAPEVVQGLDGGRPRCDCHAFAVMAFHMLATVHPFMGSLVEEGDSDWADEVDGEGDMEDKAFAGLLPWIDDADDRSNETRAGLPRALVLTERLARLFQETFGPGRTTFWRRPAIYHWPEALASAADRAVVCPSCAMSWFYDVPGNSCPYCGAPKGAALMARSFRWSGDPALDKPCWTLVGEVPGIGDLLALPERLFVPFSMTSADAAVLELQVDPAGLVLAKAEGCALDLSVAVPSVTNGGFRALSSRVQLPAHALKEGFWVYVDGAEPRVVKFSLGDDL